MDLYKQYQADYLDLVSEIKDKIQNAVELAGDDKRYAVREAENAYKEAEQLLDSMELSARTIPGKCKPIISIQLYFNPSQSRSYQRKSRTTNQI
jgi:hypothetical protein